MEDNYTISNFYYVIARNNYDLFKEMQKRVRDTHISKKGHWSMEMQSDTYNHESLKYAVTCIVFSLMCLESLFFGYSVKYLGKKYTEQHVDKLDIKSKFVMLPQLITGKKIDKGGQPYELLKKLVKDRNVIVHFKPKNNVGTTENLKFLGRNSFLKKSVDNSITTVNSIIDELGKIDPNEKKNFFSINTISECFA